MISDIIVCVRPPHAPHRGRATQAPFLKQFCSPCSSAKNCRDPCPPPSLPSPVCPAPSGQAAPSQGGPYGAVAVTMATSAMRLDGFVVERRWAKPRESPDASREQDNGLGRGQQRPGGPGGPAGHARGHAAGARPRNTASCGPQSRRSGTSAPLTNRPVPGVSLPNCYPSGFRRELARRAQARREETKGCGEPALALPLPLESVGPVGVDCNVPVGAAVMADTGRACGWVPGPTRDPPFSLPMPCDWCTDEGRGAVRTEGTTAPGPPSGPRPRQPGSLPQ